MHTPPSLHDEAGIAGDMGRWLVPDLSAIGTPCCLTKQQNTLEIRRRPVPIRRQPQHRRAGHRTHHIWRYHDDQFGLVTLEIIRPEQRTEYRHVTCERHAVAARRTVSAGTWIVELPEESCTAPWLVSWLTSVRTFIAICPSEPTVGTNARLTPYCLNSMVTSLFCCATGIGNSPPTRKLAASPLIAVRFGCARTWISSSCDSVSIRPLISTTCPGVLKL